MTRLRGSLPVRAWVAPLLFVALAAASAGCADDPPQPTVATTAGPSAVPYVPAPPEPPPAPAPPRTETGSFELYGSSFVHCPARFGVVLEHHWEFLPVRRGPRDASLAASLWWDPVNPTAEELHLVVRDRPEPNGPVYMEQWGRSPQEFVLFARDLAAWNETMYLQVGVEACPPEVAIGVNLVPSGEPQPVDWRFDWNTLSDA